MTDPATVAGIAGKLTKAQRDVLDERQRQIDVEGWTEAHDDEHDAGEMVAAAVTYALTATFPGTKSVSFKRFWPWAPAWFKPRGVRRDLVRAAALLIAEIERLDRRAELERMK